MGQVNRSAAAFQLSCDSNDLFSLHLNAIYPRVRRTFLWPERSSAADDDDDDDVEDDARTMKIPMTERS